MSDIRKLRLAIEEKLRDRQRLIRENSSLREGRRRDAERIDFLERALRSPIVEMAIEDCADQIVNEILEQAIKASQTVARETLESGDYEIGITIPSLHIRRRILRMDMEFSRDVRHGANPIGGIFTKRVDVDTGEL